MVNELTCESVPRTAQHEGPPCSHPTRLHTTNQDKPMSPAEIERELNESNGVNKNMLVQPPRILIARSTLDNVEHRPHNDRLPQRDRRSSLQNIRRIFRGDHCFARDCIETRRINRCLDCHELIHPMRSCSRKPSCLHYTTLHYTTPAPNTFQQNTTSTNARNAGRTLNARTIT